MNEKDFIENTFTKILSSNLRKFPADFLEQDLLINIPVPVKTLVLGNEFFGKFEIITTDGEQVYQADTLNEAKFFIYSSAKRNGSAYLPKDKNRINKAIEDYHKYLDDIIRMIKSEYKKAFPDGNDILSVSNKIFQKLNIIRY